jgi:hypothetical protein
MIYFDIVNFDIEMILQPGEVIKPLKGVKHRAGCRKTRQAVEKALARSGLDAFAIFPLRGPVGRRSAEGAVYLLRWIDSGFTG